MTGLLRDLDDSWTGESADAFRERLTEFETQLGDALEAMTAAGTAVAAYGDAVAEIATKAEPLISMLDTAQSLLNGNLDGLFGDDDASQDLDARSEAYENAANTAAEARDGLSALAVERTNADQTLTTALARLASATWGGLDCSAPSYTRTLRDSANDRVWDLFDDFFLGEGERGVVLGQDDAFVEKLMQSEHIRSARKQVLEELRAGTLLVDDQPLDFNRRISNNPFVLLNDAHNVLSSTANGTLPNDLLGGQNLPETFLGSYSLRVFAEEVHDDGSVTVTYVIDNDTTIDSATRIPGTGGQHVPGIYDGMVEANARDGMWQAQHQTIVWSETVYP